MFQLAALAHAKQSDLGVFHVEALICKLGHVTVLNSACLRVHTWHDAMELRASIAFAFLLRVAKLQEVRASVGSNISEQLEGDTTVDLKLLELHYGVFAVC